MKRNFYFLPLTPSRDSFLSEKLKKTLTIPDKIPMKKIFDCRRSSLGLIGMIMLFILGWYKGLDVTMGIVGIIGTIAGANAYQNSKTSIIPPPSEKPYENSN